MDLGFTSTALLLAATFGVFFYALWRARQPPDPLRVRLINYHVIQIFCLVLILLLGAHVITLVMGRPMTGAGDISQFPQ